MAKSEPELVPESAPHAMPPRDHLRDALEEIERLASGRGAGAMGKILAVATVALRRARGEG